MTKVWRESTASAHAAPCNRQISMSLLGQRRAGGVLFAVGTSADIDVDFQAGIDLTSGILSIVEI